MTTSGNASDVRLKAVIFDLDGTLVDTADEFVAVVQKLRAEHGKTPMAAHRIRAVVSNGAAAMVSTGLEIAQKSPAFEAKRQRLLELYADVVGSLASPYPGIEPLLHLLHARGIAWGIATNKPRAYTEPLLAALAMEPPPGSVICPDDVTHAKPHPESLLRNCLDLGCAPFEAVYIGDHARDIEAGRRAGMYTIAATYGYIETGNDPQHWGANALATSSEQLGTLIFGQQQQESAWQY